MAQFEHWEDANRKKDKEHIPDISADVELSMNRLFLSNIQDEDEVFPSQEKITVPPLNDLILYSISLHKHANAIRDLMKKEDAIKSEKMELNLPEFSKNTDNPLNLTRQDFRDFSNGNDVELCELSSQITEKILKKCIATLFAHIGFETSEQSALDTLTDVLRDFLRKICHHFKVGFEDEERNFTGFPHVIERVLTETGLGGTKALQSFYKSRVVKYVNVLENRCKDLSEEYKALALPKAPSPIDSVNKIVRVKVEEEDVIEVENSEGHFSIIEGDVNFAILESGYQLLNSFEAETNLQNMDEDISPGMVSSDEMSHLSPFSKKKKFK